MQGIAIPGSATATAAKPYHKVSDVGNNADVVKNGPGVVFTAVLTNLQSSPRFVKLYDKATAPDPANDTPKWVMQLPGNISGSGMVMPIAVGLRFDNGIGVAVVAGAGDQDNTPIGSHEVIVDLAYA